MMMLYVRDYDEMYYDDERKTREWLEKKGRACFERQRRRDNHLHTLGVLSGKASTSTEVEMAVPGVEGGPKGGRGAGQRAQGNARQPNTFVDPGQWPSSLAPPRRQRSLGPHTAEQRAANGPCWFNATGACVVVNCSKERRIITAQERANIPAAWVNGHLPENQKGGASGKGDRQWHNSHSDADSDGPGKGSRPWRKEKRHRKEVDIPKVRDSAPVARDPNRADQGRQRVPTWGRMLQLLVTPGPRRARGGNTSVRAGILIQRFLGIWRVVVRRVCIIRGASAFTDVGVAPTRA
jgi:hypothetical protein